jgi:hypothetical protein
MSTVCSFLARNASLFRSTLACFDRVIFKGHLPISYTEKFQGFVDYQLRLPRAEFIKTHAPVWSEKLVQHARDQADAQQRTYCYHQGQLDKDAWARRQRQAQQIQEGLIGILCVQESCPTYKLAYGKKKPRFLRRKIPQRVLYYYFQDRDLGLMHVRVQTWAPFTCQVYVNGHEFVAQQLRRKNSSFTQIDNAFTHLEDPALAQKMADRFAQLPWPKLLERYARRINPLLKKELRDMTHYWCIDQAEYATDLLLTDLAEGARFYQKLVEHAVLTFDPKKVFAFLGRKYCEHYQGESHTRRLQRRELGVCVRHDVGKNGIKMYDKGGRLLRIETSVYQPRPFRVLRTCQHRDGTSSRGYHPLCKGVGNLHHYQRLARACNQRYLDALAVVEPAPLSLAALRHMTEPCRRQERSYAGFNPARAQDLRHFAALLHGDGIARGWRNGDVRVRVYGSSNDKQQRRQQAAAVGRFLKRCHVRGWIAKIPHSQRWRVTTQGRYLLSKTLQGFRDYAPRAA